MQKRFHISIAILICLTAFSALHSQEFDSTRIITSYHNPFTIGGFAGYSYITNNSSLPIIPGTTDCGTFSKGNSQGILFGVFGEYFLSKEFISLSARLSYSSRPASLQSQRSSFLVYNVQSNTYVPLVLEEDYTAEMHYATTDLGISIYPISTIPIYTRFALDFGLPIAKNTYKQTESILSPNTVLFPNSQKSRVLADGDLNNQNVYGFNIGLGGYVQINDDIAFMPEVRYRSGLNSILPDNEWNISSIDCILGISYRPLFKEEVLLPPPPAPEYEEVPPPALVNIKPPVYLQSVTSKSLEVQETIVTQTFPILPYIFFDSASIQLASKYSINTKQFDESMLDKETLPTYYNVLNIIGTRLQKYTSATITLIGTSDGKELPGVSQRKSLGLSRASALKDIITHEWNINPDRIQIKSRDLPISFTNPRYVEGDAENRRVEIESTTPELLQPVIHTKFKEFAPLQSEHSISTSISKPDDVKEWKLSLDYKENTIITLNGNNNPDSIISVSLTADMMKKLGSAISPNDSIQGTMTITTKNGDLHSSRLSISMVKTLHQFEVSRLSLIVFDFNESIITDQNKIMMKNFLNQAMQTNSSIEIVGSTDKIGEIDYNMELSQSRANTVYAFLKSLKSDINVKRIEGIGPSNILYDNTTPEGRYYCRTVSVEVQTPIH